VALAPTSMKLMHFVYKKLFRKIMKNILGIIILSCLLACSRHDSHAESKNKPQSQSVQVVYQYLTEHSDEYNNLQLPDDLTLITEKTDHLGMAHLKFQQLFHLVPVWNKELYAHINKQNRVFRVDHNLSFIAEDFTVQAKLSTIKITQVAKKVISDEENWQTGEAQLIIYTDDKLQPKLAYYIKLENGLLTQFIILDAHNGDLLHQISGIQTKE
jgi:Zn-dependent metalloprotease